MADGLELGVVYGGTIERIKAQDGDKSRLGMAALMWISHAERPLQADKFGHALAVQPGSTDFNPNNVPSMSTLVGCCQGLIAVDKEVSTVRLIHFTLQGYLSAHPDIFSRPHSAIAEICLTYLNSQQVKALLTDPSPSTQNTPFLEFGILGSPCKKGAPGRHKITCPRAIEEGLWPNIDQITPNPSTVPYYTALVCRLGGHEEVVRMLLGREEVDPNKPNNDGRTPLSRILLRTDMREW